MFDDNNDLSNSADDNPMPDEQEVEVMVETLPFTLANSKQFEDHTKGIVDHPKPEEKPYRLSVGPDLSYLEEPCEA